MKKLFSIIENKRINFRINFLVGFVFSVLFSISCMKKASDKIEYGPEISKDKMIKAIRKIQDVHHGPQDILEGEFIQKDSTRIIRGRNVIDIMKTVGLSVVKKEITESQIKLKLVEDQITYDLSNNTAPEKVNREFTECLNKESGKVETCAVTSLVNGFAIFNSRDDNEIVNWMEDTPEKILEDGYIKNRLDLKNNNGEISVQEQDEDSRQISKVTFHKLTEISNLVSPPLLVQRQENCGGVKDCKILIHEIQFDQVYWFTDNTSEKIHVKLVSSPDVPYLANPLEDCQQGSVIVPSKNADPKNQPRVLVTFCESIRNFIKGK